MNPTIILIAAAILTGAVLLALLTNLFRQMTRLALAIGIGLAFVAVILVTLSLTTWPALPSPSLEINHLDGDGQPAQPQPAAPPKPAPSAAVAIRRFLTGALLIGIFSVAGCVIGYHLWKNYQRRERIQNTLAQAQIYGLLSGERALNQQLPRRLPQGGGNVIVLSGEGQQQPVAQPLAGHGWEVLQ